MKVNKSYFQSFLHKMAFHFFVSTCQLHLNLITANKPMISKFEPLPIMYQLILLLFLISVVAD